MDVASTEVDGLDDVDGDTLALDVAETLVEDDGDAAHELDGDTLALEDPLADELPEADDDGEHSSDGVTLGLEESLGVTLTDVDTLGLGDVQSSVWTVWTYGAMPPEVIDPTTV